MATDRRPLIVDLFRVRPPRGGFEPKSRLRCRRRVAALVALALSPELARAAEPPPKPAAVDTKVIAPKLISDAFVPYPEGETEEASVRVVVVVNADGSVRSVTPEAENAPFSEAAVRAVSSWLFEPALLAGKPVPAKIAFEIGFRPPAPVEPDVSSDPNAPSAEPSPNGATSAARANVPGSAAASAPPRLPPAVVVLGARPEPSRTASLSRAEVRELPGAFGDPFRALEGLPGITPIVSGLPFFFVRGAPPGNVGYFLDGVRMPLLFHVGVGPSVVHPALIDRVDLYPGGYPARFGRFAGGIVSGETAPPKGELHGEYNLRLFDVGALVETPFASGRGSMLLAGRYSYTALLLSLLSPETALDYWDFQARLSYDLTPRDRLSAFVFGSYDFLGQKTQGTTLTVFGTEFYRADLRYDRRLDRQGTLRTAFGLGLDRSRTQDDRYVRNRSATARTELDQPLSRSVRLRAGTDLELGHYDIELGPLGLLSPSAARIAALFPARSDLSLGARGDVVWQVDPWLDVTPGVRVDTFISDGAFRVAVDPRLSLRTVLTARLRLLVALGIAHQPPAFVVPVPGFQPGGLRGGLQRAFQESLGLEANLGDGTSATATVFQNAFFDMSDPLGTTAPELTGCPPGAFPSDSLAGDFGRMPTTAPFCGARFAPGTLGPDRSGGGGQAADGRQGARAVSAFEVRTMGSAYGLELYLKRRLTRRLGGFFSYTLSRSIRSYENRSYVATFDRTHVLNAAVAYDLGRRWRAGTRVMFYTGLPKAPDPTDPDSTRLPPFFRIDARLEKRWQLGPDAFISFIAEWLNATMSTEAVSTRCTLDGCEYQTVGPITIPSLGLEGGF